MPCQTTTPFDHYRQIYTNRSPDELQLLAHIKRFMELLAGVPEFRDALQKHPEQANAIAESYGLEIEMVKLTPFWRQGVRSRLPEEELEGYEYAKLWRGWMNDLIHFRDLMRSHGATSSNVRYNAWRSRQMARCDSQLGDPKKVIVHASAAFELSSGCSVGCWFCGLDSEPFQGYFERTPANIQLWHETLEVFQGFLGPAVQTGFCYWATEPTDNPDYLDFVDDFRKITGVLPQTTTARALKDPAWTKRLVEMHRRHRGVPARFSLISPQMLTDIHKSFSPDDILGVELVQQHKGSIVIKAQTGRMSAKKSSNGDSTEDNSTIACVSGFFVNMLKGTVELVSPCRSSKLWPVGYRVHARGRFASAIELEQWLAATTLECMPTHLPSNVVLKFRSDLNFEHVQDGYLLSNSYARTRLTGGAHTDVGHLVARGDMTYDDIFSALIGTVDFFQVTGALQTLFDRGLLDDGQDGNRFNAGGS